MSNATVPPPGFASVDRVRPRRESFVRSTCGAVAITVATLGGTWLLLSRLPADVEASRTPVTRFVTAEVRPVPANRTAASPGLDAAWLNPVTALGTATGPLGIDPPLAAVLELARPPVVLAEVDPEPPPVPVIPAIVRSVPMPDADAPLVEDVPLPTPRPPDARFAARRGAVRVPDRQMAQGGAPTSIPTGPADTRTFLQRFLGLGQPANPALGYAAPEDPGADGSPGLAFNPMPPYDRWTAIYEIASHTVYLPGGNKLEAHSGLGPFQDDPRHVDARNRGPTPPHVYDLQLREAPFHGVQALRLNPVGGGGVFGRTGLLAHTYMLGPSGASNGCVSFRDYDAFLQAFRRGEVRRLAVVARLI